MDLLAPWHLVLLLLIALVIFGPRKLSEVGGALGKTVRDLKSALSGFDDGSKSNAQAPQPPTHPDPVTSPKDD